MTQKVKLTYFKDSGKYYSEGEFEVDDPNQMYEIFRLVRNLQQQKRLPGLVDGATFNYIYVEAPGHEHDHPALIIADGVK